MHKNLSRPLLLLPRSDYNVFARAQLSGCKIGDWICTRCSGDKFLRAQAKAKAALAGGVAGRGADAEAELEVRKISIVS